MSSPAFAPDPPPPQAAPWDNNPNRPTPSDPPVHPTADPPIDPPEGTPVSEADYWAHYYEHENGYEWNNGILEVKPVSDVLTAWIYQWLLGLLRLYLDTHHNAQLTCLDFGFRLSLPNKSLPNKRLPNKRLPDKVAIRKPDLGLVLNTNTQALKELDRSYRGTFDLCVEALSDSKPAEIRRDTEQKHAEYQAAGVPEYYIIHHNPRWQLFYRRNARGLYEPIPSEDGIIRSAVVPGFRFRLEDLTRQPNLEEMIEDPVYAPFVLPSWQRDRQARERAEQARQQAEQERQQADQARQQADQARQQADQARQQAEQAREQAEQAVVTERQARAQAEQARAQAEERAIALERRAERERAEKQALLAELARRRGD